MKDIIWINLCMGLWLVFAPFVAGSTGAPRSWTMNDILLGILLIGFSAWILAAIAPSATVAGLEIVCGIWLIIAPFVFGYSRAKVPFTNDTLSGVVAVVVALIATRELMTRRVVS